MRQAIRDMSKAKVPFAEIAEKLVADGVKSPNGTEITGQWVSQQLSAMRKAGLRVPRKCNPIVAKRLKSGVVTKAKRDDAGTLAELVVTLDMPKATKLRLLEALLE